jgi:hypothetical protein
LILTSLIPPNCHLYPGKSDAQIFSGLGLDTKEGKKRIANRRYILKVDRDTNYSKFLSRCRALELDCPDNDIWVNVLKKNSVSPQPKEPKQKKAFGVRDFGSFSPEPNKMPSTRSTSHAPNYDEPGKFITIVNSTRLN